MSAKRVTDGDFVPQRWYDVVLPGNSRKVQRTSVGRAVLALRHHFDEKQTEFAKRLDVTVVSLANYETRRLPSRPALCKLKSLAAEADRADLVAVFSRARQDDCSEDGCSGERFDGRKYCKAHYREHERTSYRNRWRDDPKFRKRRKGYRAKYRDNHNARMKRRRVEDEEYRNKDIYLKRAASFKAGIARWCTQAYLKNAQREEEALTKALWAWIKSCRKRKTREELLEEARRNAKERYWRDPDAERMRVQVFKHSRPDYRIRWNETRGEREADASDGTLTKEVIAALLATSLKCPYCGDPYAKSRRSLDHIIPLAKADGRKLHSITNVLVCCRSCNNRKHAKGLTQFLEELKAAKRKGDARHRSEPVPGMFECLAN